jgi:hypothetical protein
MCLPQPGATARLPRTVGHMSINKVANALFPFHMTVERKSGKVASIGI